MKTKIKYFFLVSVISTVIMLTSCKKDTEVEDNDTTTVTDNAMAQSIFLDLAEIADEIGRTDSLNGYKLSNQNSSLLSSCANITFDTIGVSDTILVDFGSGTCLGADGRYRKGQLTITYTGNYTDSATVINLKTTNFYCNNHQINLTQTLTNKGHIGSSGSLRYDISITSTITKNNNAGTITWNGTLTKDWISGETTSTYSDDKFSISGSANGISGNGYNFNSTITNPVIKDNSCASNRRFFTQGTIEHQVSGKFLRILDFGAGNCDNTATVTIDGSLYNVTLN